MHSESNREESSGLVSIDSSGEQPHDPTNSANASVIGDSTTHALEENHADLNANVMISSLDSVKLREVQDVPLQRQDSAMIRADWALAPRMNSSNHVLQMKTARDSCKCQVSSWCQVSCACVILITSN